MLINNYYFNSSKMLPNFNKDQLNCCAWLMIGLDVFVFVFISLSNITVPYGRYSPHNLKFVVNTQLAWLLQECPSFLLPFAMFLVSDGMREIVSLDVSPNVVLLLMFMLHYFRRTFIYPLWIKKSKAPMPIYMFLFCFIFCTINGYMQAQYHLHVHSYPKEWFHSLQFGFGSFLFLVGFVINVHSDYVLTHLRKPGETGHKIPRGGLFEYISCPNFFGEIVEWGGYWLASSSFVAFAFFFNTTIVLGTRACHHHSFYQEKFEDYPKNRKALIPFIL